MEPNITHTHLTRMRQAISSAEISDWNDIDTFLSEMSDQPSTPNKYSSEEFSSLLKQGIAFITYDFGIDGVSIEIEKYALALESILSDANGTVPLHFIGGDFYDKADIVLKPSWNRLQIPGINGWSKWYVGKWFSKLYYEKMPENSTVSKNVAQAIWKQASDFAEKLGSYLTENSIPLLIPVNIPTNPGNLAIQLAIVMVTEALGTYVLSSNHDFYWEGGKPASEKQPGEDDGPRDHFFKNIDNKPFFNLFKRIYPWNGSRWIQVNINSPQSKALINRFGFDRNKVFELGTSISDKFFEEFTFEDQKLARKTMAYILSNGEPVIKPVPIREHLDNLSGWMTDQHPVSCAFKDGLTLDPTTDKTIYCLQPTRVVGRKRIAKDLQLLTALFRHSLIDEFTADPERQLVLHITGPVPIEHQADLEVVLNAYLDLCNSVPEAIADRIFINFSVGTEDHPSLKPNGLESLCIETIYRLATVILFPSETEGRGLPIIESSACGIPIICSRYYPENVFAEVVGEHLPDEEQIKYLLFPEDDFPEALLDDVTDLLLKQNKFNDLIIHNKKAVRTRYSTEMIRKKFETFFETFREM